MSIFGIMPRIMPNFIYRTNIFSAYSNPFAYGNMFGFSRSIPFLNILPIFSAPAVYSYAKPALQNAYRHAPVPSYSRFDFSPAAITRAYDNALRSIKNFGYSAVNGAKGIYYTAKSAGKNIVETAKRYMGYNEKDGSYKLFTNGRREAWCADFVSYVAKQHGVNLNQRSVEGIRQWGIKNGTYHQGAKVGDAIILKNGTSHTGIVEKVENGKVTVVEGNSSNRVQRVTYSANDRRISGYVTLTPKNANNDIAKA